MKQSLYAGAGVSTLRFPDDYFPSDGYSGVHDEMHAKVLLLSQGSEKGALITLELPSVRPWELTNRLRAWAASRLQAPYENVWLIMTHDLSAPHVPREEEQRKVHMGVLKDAVSRACEAALASLQPARVTCREGFCDVNANRDMQSRDGWWVGIHGDGPSDKTLTLLRFDSADGSPIAVLYSYALKSSVLEAAVMSDGRRYASGDVTGLANAKAEKELGCPVLFVMGAAGDQVPREKAAYLELDETGRFYSVNLAEKGYGILEKLSGELCAAVCRTAKLCGGELAEALKTPDSSAVSGCGAPAEALKAPDSSAVSSSGAPAEAQGTPDSFTEDCSGASAGEPSLRFAHFSFHADGQIPYSSELPQPPVLHFDYVPTSGEEIPVWYLTLGDTVLLGVKPEITTPVFETIRQFCPFSHIMLAALVNGGQGYIASDWDYDHYTYPGLKTPFRRGTDQIFIREVIRTLTASERPEKKGE